MLNFPPARAPIGEFVDIGDTRAHLRRDGDPTAKTIVLLHGFAGSLHWYDRLTPLLTPRFQVVRLDLRGHGHTGGDLGLDAPSQGAAVAAVITALDLKDVAVLGHSFGADVALATAERSDRVREVILVDQAPDYDHARFPPGNGLLGHGILGPVLHRMALPAFVRIGLRYGVARGFDLIDAFDHPDQGVLDHRAMSPRMARTVLVERRRRLAARPLDVQVRTLGLPTLVIHGDRDRFYAWHIAAARYRAAGARVEIIEGAGHSPNVERPAEVARVLTEFLRPIR
ncbi:alpha/beta fold hydrolase [Nocardia pseudobrasiliensis]|uniref:3-oxoadipate enol-lactonase n=1 Tax=Nocardia pseudobrasiliensis TaxID=45979 RepID=A0A370I618_9NOCA|nr:alpha/beta hydrolase [Nocardia pseudobrasiliensis]RDI66156.1 3-oxoadipate enol-lactonase [Nocardia pseudobrasiliensis]